MTKSTKTGKGVIGRQQSYSEKDFIVKPSKGKEEVYDDIPRRLPQRKDCCALIAKRLSGKSELIAHLIKTFYVNAFQYIFLFCPSVYTQSCYEDLKAFPNVILYDKCGKEFLLELLNIQKKRFKKSNKNHILIILDDFSVEKGLKPIVEDICTRRRHDGVAFIFSAQYYLHLNPTTRTNLNQICVFRNTEDQYKMIARDIPELTEDEFIDRCREATQENFSYLYVNYKTPERLFSIRV